MVIFLQFEQGFEEHNGLLKDELQEKGYQELRVSSSNLGLPLPLTWKNQVCRSDRLSTLRSGRATQYLSEILAKRVKEYGLGSNVFLLDAEVAVSSRAAHIDPVCSPIARA